MRTEQIFVDFLNHCILEKAIQITIPKDRNYAGVRAILRLTGLFDRPVSAGCLETLKAKPAIAGLTDNLIELIEASWNVAVKRLIELDLIGRSDDGIDAHPLIREYLAAKLREQHTEAFKAAHGGGV